MLLIFILKHKKVIRGTLLDDFFNKAESINIKNDDLIDFDLNNL